MGFFLPLLLGGLAFTGLPWLIHRIRRPTRNVVPFSSLMFMPETDPPVREYRKIEHFWLMLMRMIMLIILALAFARPYALRPAAADDETGEKRQHVVLVDTSLSTSAGPGFDAIRAAALSVVDSIAAGEPVAIVAFHELPEVLAPLEDPEDVDSGTKARARSALERLAPTAGATRFVPALRIAEQLLRIDESVEYDDDEVSERTIHLVSDLQRTGLDLEQARYTLGRGMALRLVPVTPPTGGNCSVEAVALEARLPDTMHVRARLRNFGSVMAEGSLQIWVDGIVRAEETVTLPAESNTVFPMAFEAPLEVPAGGEVRLVVDDVLPADNARFFVYQPDPVREIGVLTDSQADRTRPARFLEAAIADSQPLPWKMLPVDAAALAGDTGDGVPAVLILSEAGNVPEGLGPVLAGFVERGGRLLSIPSIDGFPAALAEVFFAPAGLSIEGRWRAEIDPAEFALMSWIDFDHPVFQAFRAAAYSDFSMVRFNNFFRIAVERDAPIQVIARLDADERSEGYPAGLYFQRGAGSVAVWAFPLDPDWTNVTRTRRFIPMLHETITLLLPDLPAQRSHVVGDEALVPPLLADVTRGLRRQTPGDSDPTAFEAIEGGRRLTQPGLVRWFTEESERDALAEPVNLAPKESDLRVFSADEFLLRIGAASEDVTQAAAEAPEIAQDVVHWEYGYYVLMALVAAGLMESALSMRYSGSAPRERPEP